MDLNQTLDLLNKKVKDRPDLYGDDLLIASSKVPFSIVNGNEIHIIINFREETKKINDFNSGKAFSNHSASEFNNDL